MTEGAAAAQRGDFLAEVAEDDASDTVAAIYADIRVVLGLPVVNLVYRCLAVEPARLERIWQALRPNLTSRMADEAAEGLIGIARPLEATPTIAVGRGGIAAPTLALAHATLDAYARGNSRNLLAMHALLDGCDGSDDEAQPVEAPPPGPILPMARLDSLAPGTLVLLRETSALLVGEEEPVLVPSLLRHFAASPPLLDLLEPALRGARATSLATSREAVTREARRIAAALPFPVSRLRRLSERRLAGRFAEAMSSLLVAGEILRAALPETR